MNYSNLIKSIFTLQILRQIKQIKSLNDTKKALARDISRASTNLERDSSPRNVEATKNRLQRCVDSAKLTDKLLGDLKSFNFLA